MRFFIGSFCSGVTKEAVSREERFQRASMEVGVPGETTASVHEPVAQEFHSQRDSVIIPGMSISLHKILILIYYSIEVI